ncbi:MAG TPA: glycosyltransferase [Geminicoccaceae bacterium]|nr:glycosyltransferase [Geminicoccaceae bacterium]
MATRPASPPSVRVGLVAYNGERFIAATIESILAQTYTDFELVIADDASTDATEEICRRYAARDSRVRYHRNQRNLGAAPNFNHVFELAGPSRYFKWSAHDDLITPDYLERCVAALDGDPDAVLCQSWIGVIDERGELIGRLPSRLDRKESPDPVERFGCAVLRHHMALEILGVIRTDVLGTTRLNGGYPRSDSALVAELALAGRFIEIPEPLFLSRDHPARFMRAVAHDAQAAIAWYDSSKAGQRFSPTWKLYRAYLEMVRRRVASPTERLRCYGHLLRWFGVNWNALRLGVEAIGAIEPRTLSVAMRAKRRLFGSVLPDFRK